MSDVQKSARRHALRVARSISPAALLFIVASAAVMGADGSFETGRVTPKIITIPYVATEEWDGAARWPTPKPADPACPENTMDLDFLVGIRIDVNHGREWGHDTYEIAYVDPPKTFDWDYGLQIWPADSRVRRNRHFVRIRRMTLTPASSDSLKNYQMSAHHQADPSPAPTELQFNVYEVIDPHLHDLIRAWEHDTRDALGDNVSDFHCADCTEYRVEVSDCSFFRYATVLTDAGIREFVKSVDRKLGIRQ